MKNAINKAAWFQNETDLSLTADGFYVSARLKVRGRQDGPGVVWSVEVTAAHDLSTIPVAVLEVPAKLRSSSGCCETELGAKAFASRQARIRVEQVRAALVEDLGARVPHELPVEPAPAKVRTVGDAIQERLVDLERNLGSRTSLLRAELERLGRQVERDLAELATNGSIATSSTGESYVGAAGRAVEQALGQVREVKRAIGELDGLGGRDDAPVATATSSRLGRVSIPD